MEYSFFSKEKTSHCKKKVIPWHVQKRYMESFSQLSLNQTLATAFYKKEIKSLKRNNKHLALALQRSRYLATDKENLLIDNGKILDIVNFSKLKLMDMATNMKQATACLNETLLILNSALTDNSSKCSPNSRNYKNEFKNQLQELKIEPIIEVMESTSEMSCNSNKNVQSCVHKGKISRVDDCISSPNKKCKLGKKEENIKRNCKDLSKTLVVLSNTTLKNSKKNDCALNIKSQGKKSLPKNSNLESSSSFKLPTLGLNLSVQDNNKVKYQSKKFKTVKVVLTDIAENYSPENNELVSSANSVNFKCFKQNSLEDNILIKKYITSETTGKEKSLAPNSCNPQFAASIDTVVGPNCSQDTSISSNSSLKNLPSSDVIPYQLPALPSEETENFVHGLAGVVVKTHQNEERDKNAKQNNQNFIKNTDVEKDKRPSKSRNSVLPRTVQFYFDEDYIENVDVEATLSKNRIRKNMNKANKSVLNVKKSNPLKSTSFKSNCILDDNVSKLGKNSFLVTAEIHSPPNGIYAKELKKMCVDGKREPCVVLTDIFRSNQGLLSEMVGNDLHENGCFQKHIANSAEDPKPVLNDINTAYMDFENNEENRCLPEAREIIKEKKRSRRCKIVSYKEPSLQAKIRRLF